MSRFFKVWSTIVRKGFWVWWPTVCFVNALVLPYVVDQVIAVVSISDTESTIVLRGLAFLHGLIIVSWLALLLIVAELASRHLYDRKFGIPIFGIWFFIHAFVLFA